VDVPEKQRVSGKSYKRLPGRNAISKSVYARAARFFFEAIREVMVNIKILLLITAGIGMAFTAVADERLDLLKNISAAGAPELTIKMLDQAQPKVDADLYEWILWEQERLAILAHWKQWDMLLVRIEGLPDDIPQQFKQQAATYQARAFLELGQTVTARKILRQQLWQTVASEAPQYETWRRQIIESYIEDGRIEDARVAMLRFDQDFDSTDLAWLLLRARVLIESGRHEQAILVLRDQKAWQARLTSMLASFRLKQIDQGELWAQVRKRSEEETVEAQERASLWALGYFAAEKMAPVDRVVALESLFRSEVESPLQLFQLPVDLLWQAYLQYAELVGNRSELLLGADEKWLELAARTSKETPVKARSLYAMLMLKSVDSEVANRAATGYMGTFAEIDEAEHHLLQNLFNHSGTFPSARDIPAGIRYQLVDLALRSADIEEATRLMSGLNTVPAGTSRFDWQLRQSRVLILGGRYEEGNQVLQSLIGEYREADTESTDRILQVLFLDPGQRREILFWIADSYRGLEKFEQAALLYLQSAMLPSPDAMDPWAQTARFNAAESLQESGLIDDARRIYEELLSVTQDVARRSVLNHKIQQLWLTQAAQ
jgi:hypothetical protein